LVWWVLWWDVYFYVDKHIFPNSWLNVMYLNYFWDDWWNQRWYFSENNKYIENLMLKSKKVITTTTQLVSEDKIKKMVWKISPWFKVWNPDWLNTALTINWNEFNVIVWWITSFRSLYPSLNWVTSDGESSSLEWLKNYIYFIPSDPRYTIDKNW
jgi:hypothetical protein